MDGSFTLELLRWYDAEKRDLPWRRTPTPYAIWISEIMAQQTQIDRVVGYFSRWMERYPDVASLADAHEEDALKLWEGLGYYSRARNILKAARLIRAEHGGVFPDSLNAIRALPGVGPYTAGAVASMAFGRPVPAVDANVLRVFSRLLDIDGSVRDAAVKRRVESVVGSLIPADRPGDFNQALMEFGALICRKQPQCPSCPVSRHCAALERGTVGLRPVLPPAKSVIRIDMATGVLVHGGEVLMQKRLAEDVWPGLWEFPGGVIEGDETPKQALVREYQEEVELDIEVEEKITVIQYSYTRYRVTMHAYVCRLLDERPSELTFHEAQEGRFVHPAELDGFAFPAGHRRLIEFMRGNPLYSHLF